MNDLNLDILYQFNNKYAPYAGTSITSLFENNKHFRTLDVHILEDPEEPISSENKKKFSRLAQQYNREIKFYQTQKLVDIMKQTGIPPYRGSYAANMRMFCDQILPASIQRLLYLDSDTIVCEHLDYLANLDFHGNYLAMVLDSLGARHKIDIGLNKNDNYYNSGMILFNMPLWREKKCEEQIIEHVKNIRAHYPAPDQDLINRVIANKIMCLDLRYNLQPTHFEFTAKNYLKHFRFGPYYSYTEIENAIKLPVIIHCYRYLGEFPWHQNNLHPNTQLFDHYLKISEWNDYIKLKANPGILIRIEKIIYRFLPRKFFIVIFKYAHRLFLIKVNNLSLQNRNDKQM